MLDCRLAALDWNRMSAASGGIFVTLELEPTPHLTALSDEQGRGSSKMGAWVYSVQSRNAHGQGWPREQGMAGQGSRAGGHGRRKGEKAKRHDGEVLDGQVRVFFARNNA